MSHTQHGALTPIEKRTVLALNEARQRVIADLQEIDAAIQAQVVGIAERQHLPPDQYAIQGGQDGQLHLIRPEAPASEMAQMDQLGKPG